MAAALHWNRNFAYAVIFIYFQTLIRFSESGTILQNLIEFDTEDMLQDPYAVDIFKKFLTIQRGHGEESTAEQLVGVYKLAEAYKRDYNELREEHIKDLYDKGIFFSWKKELENALGTTRRYEMPALMKDIQKKCSKEIEGSNEYKSYKEFLMDRD